MKLLSFSAALLCAAAVPAVAHATVEINVVDADPTMLGGGISVPGQSYSQWASIGRFKLSGTEDGNAASFLTYCIDIFHEMHAGTFEIAPLSTLVSDPLTQTRLLALVSNADPLIAAAPTVADQQNIGAAIQLAAWELAYETGPTYSFANGTFQSSGGTTDAARALGLTYINNVIDGTWKPVAGEQLQLLYARDNQSQMFLSAAVPEPATWAMMLGGFGLMGAALRARRTRVRFAQA